jgi:two-component system, NarL family, capsular synthesis sensor histidine kinase RcsC
MLHGLNRTALDQLRRSQRILLFGGGVVTTIMLLLAAVVNGLSEIHQFIVDERHAYSVGKNLVDARIEASESSLRTTVASAELAWAGNDAATRALVRRFAENDRQVAIQPAPAARPNLVLGIPEDPLDVIYASRFLALSAQIGRSTVASGVANRRTREGYLYSMTHDLMTIIPAPLPQNDRATTALQNRRQLMESLRIDPRDLAATNSRGSLAGPGQVRWIVPSVDPLSGEKVIRLAVLAFHDNQPFAVLIGKRQPDELLDAVRATGATGVFVIVGRDGKVIGTMSNGVNDPSLVAAAIAGARTAGPAGAEEYRNGIFTINDQFGDTGWSLVYAFSWNTIIAGVKVKLLANAFAAAAILITLWVLLFIVNRRVLTPIFERSQRVFDSENLSRTLVETAPTGLALISLETGEPLLSNAAMAGMAERLITPGSTLAAEFVRLHAGHVALDPDVRSTGTMHDELCLPTHDGDQVDLAVNTGAGRYQGHDVIVSAVTDVTGKNRLEQQLRDAKQAADLANAAKSAFLATMSHEIRTPLNAILGNLELLAHSPLNILQKDRLATVRSSSDGLLAIVSDILDFSKIEAGEMWLEDIGFKLIDVVELALAMFAPVARAKKIQLFCRFDAPVGQVMQGDPTRLGQVLNNLLSNAIKFTETGQVALWLRIENDSAAQAQLVISVRDTGIGLSDPQRATIFRAFSQADFSINRRFGGTGLGLTLCKCIVEAMQGTIGVESRLGVGSTFTVRIPFRAATPATPESTLFDGQHVLVLSSDDEWFDWTLPHLEEWGLAFDAYSEPDLITDTELSRSRVVIIFRNGSDWLPDKEIRLGDESKYIVECRLDGPARPVSNGRGHIVSSYSLTGLQTALQELLVPVPQPVEALPGATLDLSPGAGVADSSRPLRVLVAEDNPANQYLFIEQLRMLGCDAHVVKCGKDALEALSSAEWDILLTDLNMPGMSGYELARAARARRTDLLVFAVTAHVTTEERTRASAVGMARVLTKPLSLATLHEALAVVARSKSAHLDAPSERDSFVLGGAQIPEHVRASFNSSSVESLRALRDAQKQGDVARAMEELHFIKGALGIFRQYALANQCTDMENALKERGIVALDSALDDFEKSMCELVDR